MPEEPAAELDRLLARLGADLAPALESLGFPVYALDADGVVGWLNRAAVELLGDVVGSRFVDVLAPEAAHRARAEFAAKLIGTKARSEFPVVLADRDGKPVRLEISSVPLRAGRRVVGVLGVGAPREPEAVEERPPPQLTPRQREVLALLARGLSTPEMARELGISEETVRNHVRHLLRRLGARSRLGAVLEARRRGVRAD